MRGDASEENDDDPADSGTGDALARPLERFSAETITEAGAVRALLRETVERGYSISQQGFEIGVISAAAPILTPAGRPMGALAVAAPTARADTVRMHEIGRKIAAAARGIAERYYGNRT